MGLLRAGGLESRDQSLCLFFSGDFFLAGVGGGMEGTPLLRFELQKAGSEARELALEP